MWCWANCKATQWLHLTWHAGQVDIYFQIIYKMFFWGAVGELRRQGYNLAICTPKSLQVLVSIPSCFFARKICLSKHLFPGVPDLSPPWPHCLPPFHFAKPATDSLRTWIWKIFKKLSNKRKKRLGLCNDGVCHQYLDRDGNKKVQGGKRLKETQQYPLRFCRKVAKWHTKTVVPRSE